MKQLVRVSKGLWERDKRLINGQKTVKETKRNREISNRRYHIMYYKMNFYVNWSKISQTEKKMGTLGKVDFGRKIKWQKEVIGLICY